MRFPDGAPRSQDDRSERPLPLAGGVAANCVANGRILREGPFENLWIQPAAGDAGGALGVALFIHYQLLDNPRTVASNDSQQGSLLGPEFSDDQIERVPQVGGRDVSPDATPTRNFAEAIAESTSPRRMLLGGSKGAWNLASRAASAGAPASSVMREARRCNRS